MLYGITDVALNGFLTLCFMIDIYYTILQATSHSGSINWLRQKLQGLNDTISYRFVLTL